MAAEMGRPLLQAMGSHAPSGLVQDLARSSLMTLNVGTAHFAAPEVLWLQEDEGRQPARHATSSAYSLAADVYSMGMLLWAIGAREIPFAALGSTVAVIRCVKSGRRPPVIRGACPPLWQELIDRSTTHNPNERPSSSALAVALESMDVPSFSGAAEFRG